MAPDPTPPTEAERLRDNLLAIVATKEHLTVDGIVEFHGRLVAPVAAALDALLARLRAAEARAERYRRALEGWREDVARVERYAMENPGTTPEIVAARLRDVLARRALADRGADA